MQGEIVVKLKDRLTSTAANSTEDKAHILHSLGNTGSPLAMTVLLEYVAHGNRDVQEAAISGLRMFTSSKLVQDAFVDLLEESSDEEVCVHGSPPAVLHCHSQKGLTSHTKLI